jgi:hypothetical protein
VDHFAALSFLRGLLLILRDSGYAGLVLVLDEVETIQRVRSDVRDKSLNALRQLMDEMDLGRFPGLYLVVTGTPAFLRARRVCCGWSHWLSGCTSTFKQTPALTIRGLCRFACRLLITKG